MLKFNSDATWKSYSMFASIAIVVRNCYGRSLYGRICKAVAESPVVVEALGVLEAMKLALEMEAKNVLMEIDSKLVHSAIIQNCFYGNRGYEKIDGDKT